MSVYKDVTELQTTDKAAHLCETDVQCKMCLQCTLHMCEIHECMLRTVVKVSRYQ